jgi:hypothetical protein
MRKVNVIALLFLYLSVNTGMQEFLKIPYLVQHFTEHRKENQGVSFAAFITLHYFDDNKPGTNDKQHSQLPFKGSDVIVLSTAVPAEPEQVLSGLVPGKVMQVLSHYARFYCAIFQVNIWQPPRA